VQLAADIATEADAAAIADLRTEAAEDLTRLYGRGHWSFGATEKGVRRGILTSKVLVAKTDGRIVGTLRLAAKKPWAIDGKHFTAVRRPLYLIDMAVDPRLQRQGVGRYLLQEARLATRAWRGDAIRLDAYDAPAGAGGFYARCGFREVGRVSYRGVPLIYFEWLAQR